MNRYRFDLHVFGLCGLCLFLAACLRQERPPHSSADELPFGKVLDPVADQTITGPFAIRGWALSENGIQEVNIYEDRLFLASARMGLSSPEAQQAQPDFPGSARAGWEFDADPGVFTSGTHELTVEARSTTGAVRELGSWKVTIGTPFGHMDEPADGRQVTGPISIRGWAVSEQGIDQVMIYVDGKFFTNALRGDERVDVKKAFPRAKDSLTSGWHFDAGPDAFSAGEHEIVARARSTAGAVRELGRAKVRIGR